MAERCSIIVGTAGWAIPRASAAHFPADGSTLARYAHRFTGVEINSTFYRSHRPATYARWRDSVPDAFRFSVKLPKIISHEKRLVAVDDDLTSFLAETAELGAHRGPLLLQLPPKLAFDHESVDAFLRLVRKQFDGPLAIEPRHPSWFTEAADALMVEHRAARVGADPPRAEGGRQPGGFRGLTYLRVHGAPRVYFSSYDTAQLAGFAATAEAAPTECWCIFDNTASGAAAANALDLKDILAAVPR